MPGGHDALHVEVVHFFVIVGGGGRGCNPLSVLLLPLLASFGVLLGALDGEA
jgi:hypothetical protein